MLGLRALTMIRPSIRMSVFSNSQICTRVFCGAAVGTRVGRWRSAVAAVRALAATGWSEHAERAGGAALGQSEGGGSARSAKT